LKLSVVSVFGQVFLSHFDYLFDLRRGRLVFGSNIDPPGIRVPLLEIEGLPAVSTSMGPLIVDSGAQELTLYKSTVFNGETLTMYTYAGPVKATVQGAGPLMISSRKVPYGKALVLPCKLQPTAIPGLLPVSLFNSVYISNSGRYAVLY